MSVVGGVYKAVKDRPYTAAELTTIVTDHEARLNEIYPSAAAIAKIWTYLRFATPMMILSLLGNVNSNSLLGKFISHAWTQISGS